MKFRPDYVQVVRDWFKKNGIDRCVACKHSAPSKVGWIVSARAPGDDAVAGGDSAPMVQVICERCHFVSLLAAGPLGLFDDPAS